MSSLKTAAYRGAMVLAVFGGVLALAGGLIAPTRALRRMTVYTRGYMDWDTPRSGLYGATTWGMFGVLPDYLGLYGVELNKADSLQDSVLEHTDVLCMINLTTAPTPEEGERVLRWVRSGGRLLILGDHTNLFGLATATNSLLRPLGCEIQSDAALGMAHGFQGSLTVLPANDWEDAYGDLQQTHIGVGASLRTWGRFRPVLIGRFGFADKGNPENEKGSFFGDLTYNRGEQFGDIVLVAGCSLGRGRILVFGDTDPFQNPILPVTWQTSIKSMLNFLARDGRGAHLRVWGMLSGAVGLWGMLAFGAPTHGRMILIAILALAWAGLARVAFRGPLAPITVDWNRSHRPLAVVYSHHSHFGIHDLSDSGSIVPLTMELWRLGYLPVVSLDSHPLAVDKSQLCILVSPREAPSKEEVDGLAQLLDRGGTLVIAASHPLEPAANEILSELGSTLMIKGIPLGPVPLRPSPEATPQGQGIAFVRASPLVWRDVNSKGRVDMLFQSDGLPIVAREKLGRGHLLLLGDSHWLGGANLEGVEKGNEDNIKALEHWLGPN